MRVLLVEDETGMVANVRAALAKHDIILDHAGTLEIAEEALQEAVHDAILLDRNLPDGDGMSLIPLIRKKLKNVPIIVLSARGASKDRIEGLDVGADDYLGKPFSMDELLARLRAVLRRNSVIASDVIRLGNIEFDTVSRQTSVEGVSLELPRREILVLETLIRRAGRTVTRDSLAAAVFGFDDEIASNTLDAHISRLRKRLTDARSSAEIHTIRGVGYLLKASL